MKNLSALQPTKRPKPGILGGMLLRLLIQRLFLPTLALLILALALSGYTSHRTLEAQQKELVRVLANTVETFLYNAGNMLRASAKIADQSDPMQLAFYLKSSREGFGYFDTIYRLDKNGIIVQLEPHEPRYMGLDQTRQPFFVEAKTRQELYISKPFHSMRTGKPTVIMTWPLTDGGMMVAELSLGTFQDAVAEMHHKESKNTIIIVDQDGTFLAHPRSELIAQQARIGHIPSLQFVGPEEIALHYHDGKQWMEGSAVKISSTGWVVLVQVPILTIHWNIIKVAIPLFILCIVVWSIVVLTFRKRFWQHVVAPLTDLSQTAIAISSGDLERTAKVEKKDEIGIVAKAFNYMTAQLREVIGHLKERIDELTQTREELKMHKEQLESLVDARTAALTERTQQLETQALELSVAKQQAEQANATKSDFLARMSHEIRTPLNAITGLTHIVLKSELTVEQRDYLGKVQIASSNLLAVINDILDFSKVEAGHLELEHHPFILDEVMEQLADLFSDRIAHADMELIFAVSPEVPSRLIGDAGRLTQVLTNLVANAIKFTPQGEIVVGVEPEGQTDQGSGRTRLKFRVSDTGTGIAADVMPLLFDPFTQADTSLTREHKGTGLGLAICQRLVALMGGRIWAQSSPGQGSIFFFTVTLDILKEAESRFSLPMDLHGIKSLVVDDSDTARQAMSNLLQSLTCTVTAVDSGRKAIEELQRALPESPYQLVLLDWKMPGLDGIETARRIRKLEYNVQDKPHATAPNPDLLTPIIILVTAYGQLLVQERINTDIADSVLLKPVKPSQLFNTIMEIFGKRAPMVTHIKTEKTDAVTLVGRRVLVVEDSAMNIEVVIALLKETGLEVEVAENGKVAVDHVTTAPLGYYDLVLMDIQMPVMDGYQATERIREWEAKVQLTDRRIPIIALTAHALKGEKQKCLATGMDDYIAKPINEKRLHRVLRQRLSPQHGDTEKTPPTDAKGTTAGQAVIDSQGALKRMGGRKHIYTKILKKFEGEFGQAPEIIARHLADDDREAASRMAHSTKGAASTIGAVGLSQTAAKLEKALTRHDPPEDNLLQIFKDELAKVLEAVESMVDTE